MRNKSILCALAIILVLSGCAGGSKTVPQEQRFGIYTLDLKSQKVELVHSAATKYSSLVLSNAGDRLAWSQQIGGEGYDFEEIFSLKTNGTDLQQLTDNKLWDFYPAFGQDDELLYFLSKRNKDLDLYQMNPDGTGQAKLFDSGDHDADIHAMGGELVFTSGSKIWKMKEGEKNASSLTNPARAAQKNKANLPFGDYDPRLSPDGTKIVFERLHGDDNPHGNYDIFVMDADGSNEKNLTNNGWSQGLASWSHDGQKLAYVVSAIHGEGKYDLYMMNSDGTNQKDITPKYFPANLLVHQAVFSQDDSQLYFVGEWWE